MSFKAVWLKEQGGKVPLAELAALGPRILKGEVRGRTVVDVNA
ncbi:MAG TPA: hypothetical protein VEK12_01960 [Alphaproteobacteria bacterium]|nr:hypothetical protein [Alphaproteobacteria bacterium]